MKKTFLLIIISFFFKSGVSQFSIKQNTAFNFSFSYSLGTHFQRFGLACNFFIFYKNIQFSNRIDYHYNFKNLGPNINGHELQLNLALLLAYAKSDTSFLLNNKELFPVYLKNLTHKKNSFAYSYNIYLDQIGTSQQSGTIYLQFNRFELISENDMLGQAAADKYRTGAIKAVYMFDSLKIAINSIMWTANPKNQKQIKNSNYNSRWGYKDLSDAKYGKFSAGIFSVSLKSFKNFNNNLFKEKNIHIGFDSEYIRHFWQNILIHDLYFIPKKWNKAQNPHYPMLMENGEPYLFEQGQKVKKINFFYNINFNSPVFY